MFQHTADAVWSDKLSAYPDGSPKPDLTGETVTLSTHVNMTVGSNGTIVGGFDCEVDMEHDGEDWSVTGIGYKSEFGGPSRDFDVVLLRARAPDGTFADLFDREILKLIDWQYNELANRADAEKGGM